MKTKAYREVNEEMILLYFDVGKYINELNLNAKYRDKVIENLSKFIKLEYPEIKGFSKRNLKIMS